MSVIMAMFERFLVLLDVCILNAHVCQRNELVSLHVLELINRQQILIILIICNRYKTIFVGRIKWFFLKLFHHLTFFLRLFNFSSFRHLYNWFLDSLNHRGILDLHCCIGNSWVNLLIKKRGILWFDIYILYITRTPTITTLLLRFVVTFDDILTPSVHTQLLIDCLLEIGHGGLIGWKLNIDCWACATFSELHLFDIEQNIFGGYTLIVSLIVHGTLNSNSWSFQWILGVFYEGFVCLVGTLIRRNVRYLSHSLLCLFWYNQLILLVDLDLWVPRHSLPT